MTTFGVTSKSTAPPLAIYSSTRAVGVAASGFAARRKAGSLSWQRPTRCGTYFSRLDDQGRREVTDRRIEVLTIASERACRACAAREHPAPVR